MSAFVRKQPAYSRPTGKHHRVSRPLRLEALEGRLLPTINFAPAVLSNGVAGMPYPLAGQSGTISVSGDFTGIVQLSATGLPEGMHQHQNENALVLDGTPIDPIDTATITVTATATLPSPQTATHEYVISVGGPLGWYNSFFQAPTDLPSTSVGKPYDFFVRADGGTGVKTYAIDAGSDP